VKNAIIIGSSGQDGTLLSEYLTLKKYNIFKIPNPKSSKKIVDTKSNINILDYKSMKKLFKKISKPEVYYLAAYHHSSEQNLSKKSVHDLFHKSLDIHVKGLINVLDVILNENKNSKLFYASSSLIFSGDNNKFQNEKSPLNPIGAYAITKSTGNMIVKEFRERYGIFCSTGILYNHESGLRSKSFLTRRIIETAYRISKGSKEKCKIVNLNAQVDWGLAYDYVKIFNKILQLKKPEDFVIASGKLSKVQDFISEVFNYFGLNWKNHVVKSSAILIRRTQPHSGNIQKLKKYIDMDPKYKLSKFVSLLIKDVLNRNHNLNAIKPKR
jgi:GDPmannose 4,6-dehydratase